VTKRIGSIIHGALGDCYEQILCLKQFKQAHPDCSLIVFFAVENRLRAFRHFDLSMFAEIHTVQHIHDITVDEFYQFQIHDKELREQVLDKLDVNTKQKFDFSINRLPWHVLKDVDYSSHGLDLPLSDFGKDYLKFANQVNQVDEQVFKKKFTVGFLWRYRQKGKIDSMGQYPLWIVRKNLDNLLMRLVDNYDAFIFACGMNRGVLEKLDYYEEIVETAGLALGERLNTFADFKFSVDEKNITYLNGVGFAAEMEILSLCDLIIAMPSGFSEPLWMKQKQPVVLVFPPLEYLAKLWRWRAPFFDNHTWKGRWYNTFTFHSAKTVLRHLQAMGCLP